MEGLNNRVVIIRVKIRRHEGGPVKIHLELLGLDGPSYSPILPLNRLDGLFEVFSVSELDDLVGQIATVWEERMIFKAIGNTTNGRWLEN